MPVQQTNTDDPEGAAAVGRPADLDALFAPSSVAVIGASDNAGRIGGRVLKRFIDHFAGPIYAVNANRDTVQGRACFRAIELLPEAPDLAVLAIPAAQVLDAVTSLAQRGCRAAIILSSGFAELGPDGKAEQDRIAAVARSTGMRIIGPNCVGTIAIPNGMLATFADLQMRPMAVNAEPGVAIVSQSGALGAVFFQAADALGLRVNYVCTTGNEADVSAAEALLDLIERPDVSTVMVFLEALREPEILYKAGRRAQELGKPIVAMKVGVSETGVMAAASHSGSLAAPDRYAQALLDSAGIIRADSPLELLNMSAAFAGRRLPDGNRVAVMTLSGGVGIMIADEMDKWGLILPRTRSKTAETIARLIPVYGSTKNPIDYTANAVNDPKGFAEILDAVATDEDFDMILVSGLSMATFDEAVAAIRNAKEKVSKPILVSMSGPAPVTLNEVGIPCIGDSVQAAKALGALWHYAREHETARSEAPLLGSACSAGRPTTSLDGEQTRALLSEYGVPVVAEMGAVGATEAAVVAAQLGFPVAVKLDQSVAAHKTEIGGVRLDLRNADEVADAVASMQAAIGRDDGVPVIVQRMAAGGLELTVGATRDRALGPAIMVGIGGVMVEILDEIQMSLVPVSGGDARRMVLRLCQGRLATSPRGLSDTNIGELSAVIEGLSRLMVDCPDVVEVDVNPVIVTVDGLVAVDGLVRVETAG